jgi:hypothetical protein
MSRSALIAAGLALAVTATVAHSKSQARAGACPSISILADASRLAQMQGEIVTPELDCSVSGSTAKSNMSFMVKSAIAPEASVGARTVPYFVAVIANGQVIEKKIFELNLPFSGSDRQVFVKETIARIDIPIASGKQAEDYSVTIGFQLTEEQVAYNRTAGK